MAKPMLTGWLSPIGGNGTTSVTDPLAPCYSRAYYDSRMGGHSSWQYTKPITGQKWTSRRQVDNKACPSPNNPRTIKKIKKSKSPFGRMFQNTACVVPYLPRIRDTTGTVQYVVPYSRFRHHSTTAYTTERSFDALFSSCAKYLEKCPKIEK